MQIKINMNALVEYDVKNREAVMLIKLSVTDEMLPVVQTGDDAFTIWWNF